MDKIILIIFSYANKFVLILADVITNPRTFIDNISIADRNPRSGVAFMAFAALVSAVLSNTIFFQNVAAWISYTVVIFFMIFVSTFLCGIILIISWRFTMYAVKKIMPVSNEKIMPVYLYQSGAWNILLSILLVFVLFFTSTNINNLTPNEILMYLYDPS